jgi:hypothetical protein
MVLLLGQLTFSPHATVALTSAEFTFSLSQSI